MPSPATPAFDEYIERHGGSLCLEVWNTAMQSTDSERSRRSFMRAASDIVEQLAVPERRLLEEKRRGHDRIVSRHEEVQQFVDHVRAALAMQQERCMTTIESVNQFFRDFFRAIRSLSDKEPYRLSHVSASVRIGVVKSDTYTKEMAVLLNAIRKTVAIDKADELAGVIADIERETKRLAAPDGMEATSLSDVDGVNLTG